MAAGFILAAVTLSAERKSAMAYYYTYEAHSGSGSGSPVRYAGAPNLAYLAESYRAALRVGGLPGARPIVHSFRLYSDAGERIALFTIRWRPGDPAPEVHISFFPDEAGA